MKTYKERLFHSLVHHGWEIVSCCEVDEWWAAERWQIRSVRENWGHELVLSFLVDPQFEGRDKSAAVWAVAVNNTQPGDRLAAEDGIALLPVHDVQFPESLDGFIAAMDAHRRKQPAMRQT